MAHNPKLQVFRIDLKPKAKNETACFRDILAKKLNTTGSDTDTDFWNLYWKDFVKSIDTEFIRDEKTKKAFTLYNNTEKNVVASHYDEFVLEGIIKGGKYNIERDVAKIDNKDDVEKIEKGDIILDQFYFLLYTPLNSTKGLLLLQTYTEDSIYSVFSNFLVSFFRNASDYFDLKMESFVPAKIREEYQKTAKLKGFSFTKRELIGNVGEGVVEDLEEFDITIKITPKQNSSVSKIKSMLAKISPIKFNERELEQFAARVYLAGDKEKGAYYDLEKDIESIKPTIYLENRISVSSITGLPDFGELKTFCFELLKSINNELRKEQVHESSVLS